MDLGFSHSLIYMTELQLGTVKFCVLAQWVTLTSMGSIPSRARRVLVCRWGWKSSGAESELPLVPGAVGLASGSWDSKMTTRRWGWGQTESKCSKAMRRLNPRAHSVPFHSTFAP